MNVLTRSEWMELSEWMVWVNGVRLKERRRDVRSGPEQRTIARETKQTAKDGDPFERWTTLCLLGDFDLESCSVLHQQEYLFGTFSISIGINYLNSLTTLTSSSSLSEACHFHPIIFYHLAAAQFVNKSIIKKCDCACHWSQFGSPNQSKNVE